LAPSVFSNISYQHQQYQHQHLPLLLHPASAASASASAASASAASLAPLCGASALALGHPGATRCGPCSWSPLLLRWVELLPIPGRVPVQGCVPCATARLRRLRLCWAPLARSVVEAGVVGPASFSSSIPHLRLYRAGLPVWGFRGGSWPPWFRPQWAPAASGSWSLLLFWWVEPCSPPLFGFLCRAVSPAPQLARAVASCARSV
jgi:hypothetical protein